MRTKSKPLHLEPHLGSQHDCRLHARRRGGNCREFTPHWARSFDPIADQDLTTDDNTGTNTNGAGHHAPSTNSGSVDTNQLLDVSGIRG